MNTSDPDLKFSTDVTEVIESLKNSGYASTNADIVLLGATLCFKFGYQEFSAATQNYVRLGVLLRQVNFEAFATALIVANMQKNGEEISKDSLSLEKNIGYLSKMANSGLIHLKHKMRDFSRESSEILPVMMKEALGIRSEGLSHDDFTQMSEDIEYKNQGEVNG